MGCFGDACHSCQAMSRLWGPGHGVTMGPRPRYAKQPATNCMARVNMSYQAVSTQQTPLWAVMYDTGSSSR